VQILCENTDDDKVAIQVLPHIPDPVLEQIVKNNVDSFRIIVQAYDEKVSGSLAFSYCDVVADFYEKVFEWTNDFAVRELILRRLPAMGYHHNRWYVGKVFGRIISSLQDPPLQMVARDVLQEDSNITE
jgi:histone H3/H4